MENQTSSFEWEINEFQDQQKKKIYFFDKFSFFFLILIFFLLWLGFLGVVIAIIIFVNLKQNDRAKQGENTILEKYKINEVGIVIDNKKEGKKDNLFWNELISFYSYAKINPLLGFVTSKIAGDDFVVVNKNNKHIKLRAGINDTLKVQQMLLKKLKFKAPNKSQNILIPSLTKKYLDSSFNPSFSSVKFDAQNPSKKAFIKSSQENFLQQKRIIQKHNLQKEKDKFKNNFLIIAYITISFVLFILYFIFDKI
ncbi:hypothetical protein KAI56_02900 [Candidatus Parcubacteria bacterium]|nr:hypothetical protein [Candidatus Parcubacteria bacterium]